MSIPPFHVKALYDYSSKEEDDLKFPSGQVILVTEEEDADWYFGEYDDGAGEKQEGLFPKNFVKLLEPDRPPRPTRSGRSRKDNDTPALAGEGARIPTAEEHGIAPALVPGPVPAQSTTVSEHFLEEAQPPIAQAVKIATSSNPTQKPVPAATAKPVPPPTAEKPTSGSFRDRINAFNKSTAPPPAPNKPSGLGSSGGSGFVKKAFVAPPPSKNAYVPPPREPPSQKVYRREEDPEVTAPAPSDVENGVQVVQSQAASSAEVEEEQPKPTTLKDRIALLQKQQMEQAARHAEAGQKKEKPKRPQKKQEPQESIADAEDGGEDEHLQRMNSMETTGNRSMEASRDFVSSGVRHAKQILSQEATPVASPTTVAARDFISDPNDADQSGTADTEEGEDLSTGRDDSDENPRHTNLIQPQYPAQTPLREADIGDEEDNADEDKEEEEEDEDIDPEVKRRMEIRERMAKMSGGMGMAGMFGPPGVMAPRAPVKRGTTSSERNISGNSGSTQADDSSSSKAPPIPIMPVPGLQKVQSLEENSVQPEVTPEEGYEPLSVIQAREPEQMPDVEDVVEEPLPAPRRSVERPVPPTLPQGKLSCTNLLMSMFLTSSRSPSSCST